MRISDWSSDVCSSDLRILGHNANLLSERCLRNLRNILAIDQNAPGLHIIEAEEQARDGRLACARRPHDGKRLPRRNVDVETVKDFPICSVTDMHIFEANQLGREAWRDRVCQKRES